jgi:hypothetical protein
MPPAFSGTLQEAFDVLVERLRIVSPFKLLRVVVSDVAPTSNQGLWLKFGTKPYVWDESTSTYIPLDINDSLSYPFDTLVDIILANFDPTTKYLLANRINSTAQLSDKIITAAKFVDAFGTPKSIITIDAAGKATFTVVTPGQTVFADPSTGVPVAGLLPVASIAPGTLGQTITTVNDGGLKARWSNTGFVTPTASYVLLSAISAIQLFAHGITGATRIRPYGFLVCKNTSAGFSPGDVVPWVALCRPTGTPGLSESQLEVSEFADQTNVGLIVNANFLGFSLNHKTTSVAVDIVATDWYVGASATAF